MLSGWAKGIKITIPAQTEELTNFPLLVNLTSASGTNDFDCSEIFDDLGSNSLKIAAEVGDTGTQCYVEVERWDNVNYSAQIWINVPTVSSSVDTEIILHWDSAQSDNTAYVGIIGSTSGQAVWNSGYAAVYHLSQDPSATIKDSTSNAKHGTSYGTMLSTALVDGPTGKATVFDGANDYISIPDPLTPYQAITVESVANKTSTSGSNTYCIVSTLYPDGAVELPIGVDTSTAGGKFGVGHYTGTTWEPWLYSASAVTTGEFHYMAGSYDGAAVRNYLDGAVTSRARTGNLYSSTNTWKIGARWDSATQGGWWPGYIRSVRISSVTRSSNWLNTARLADFDQLVSMAVSAVSELDVIGSIEMEVSVDAEVSFMHGVQELQATGNIALELSGDAYVNKSYFSVEEALKHSLSIIHGTVYGTIFPLSVGQLADSSNSSYSPDSVSEFEAEGLFDADGEMPDYTYDLISSNGYTDNLPIEVIHWSGEGTEPIELLSQFKVCTMLYTRIGD